MNRKQREYAASLPPGIMTAPFPLVGCVLHKIHKPVPATSQMHHIYPIGMGGPRGGERVPTCGSGHLDVHAAIAAVVKGEALPRGIGRQELEMARSAIARSKGKT